jgi:hypothetical protein
MAKMASQRGTRVRPLDAGAHRDQRADVDQQHRFARRPQRNEQHTDSRDRKNGLNHPAREVAFGDHYSR